MIPLLVQPISNEESTNILPVPWIRFHRCRFHGIDRLVYMGKVGTGWSRTVSSQIRKQLDTVVSPKSKLTKPIKKPKATWVEPTFFADIEYRDITSEGLLRQSSFKGLKRN
jgi:ATP-dependent DNA ligase